MNFIRNRNFRAGPQTSLEGFICPQNSDKQQKIKVFGRSGGGTYNDVVPECYIITMDGLESEHFADVAPYIFEDLGRAYAVVKKQYRNTDLKKKCYRTQPRRNTFLRFCLSEIHLAHVGMYRVYAQWSNSNQKGSTN